jgi:hypothetical protein
MPSSTVWYIAPIACAIPIVIAAALAGPNLQMLAAAAIAAAIAFAAVRENARLLAAGAPENKTASSTARFAWLVWAWGALGIFLTYTVALKGAVWPEWWHFVLAFAFAGTISQVYANMLDRDAQSGRSDQALLKIGRALLIAQIAGVALGVISMLADGKFPRDASHSDWAACNIFFFGALAIAIISIEALRSAKSS